MLLRIRKDSITTAQRLATPSMLASRLLMRSPQAEQVWSGQATMAKHQPT